jgi:cell division protein FtsB
MWFKSIKNESLNSAEYEKLSKRITELVTEIETLRTKFKILETNYDNLRGNFNRKLAGIKKDEKAEEIVETENNIKPSIFLSPNGTPI